MRPKLSNLIFFLLVLLQTPFLFYCISQLSRQLQPSPQVNFLHLMMLQPSAFVFDRNPLFSRLTFEVKIKDSDSVLKIPYSSTKEKFKSFIEFVLFRRILVSYHRETQHLRILKYYICQNKLKDLKDLKVQSFKEVLEVGENPLQRFERHVECD